MPISHTCPSCCRELGSIRAIPDPHYGLGVVVCPQCEHAVVRGKHPDIIFWRHVRRTRKSLQRLILAVLFTALASGATIGMAFWMLPEVTSRAAGYQMPDFSRPEIPFQIGIALFITTMAGCIARTIYAHLRFPVVLGMFLLLIALFLNIDWLITRVMILLSDLFIFDAGFRMPDDNEIKRRFLVFPTLIPPFLAGMSIGVIFNTMIKRGSTKRTIRIRRRLRRRRSRLD